MACGRVLETTLPAISNGHVRRYSNNRTIAQFGGSGALSRLSQSEFGSGTDEHVAHEQNAHTAQRVLLHGDESKRVRAEGARAGVATWRGS